VVTAYGLNGL